MGRLSGNKARVPSVGMRLWRGKVNTGSPDLWMKEGLRSSPVSEHWVGSPRIELFQPTVLCVTFFWFSVSPIKLKGGSQTRTFLTFLHFNSDI